LIDTIKIQIPVKHEPFGTKFLQNTPGEERLRISNGSVPIQGPYLGCKLVVWSKFDGKVIQIEGSPAKFFTGQNIVGSEDLPLLVKLMTNAVLDDLNITPTRQERMAIERGDIRLLRLDLAAHVRCTSRRALAQIIRGIRIALSYSDQTVMSYGSESVYVGHNSVYSTLKFYDKGAEIQAKGLPDNVLCRKRLNRYAGKLLRVELTLRARGLERLKMVQVRDWSLSRVQDKLIADLRKLNLSGPLPPFIEKRRICLNPMQNALVALHLQGIDLCALFENDRSFKRQAAIILDKIGIDLKLPFTVQISGEMPDLSRLPDQIRFGPHKKAMEVGLIPQ
jgi:hypothetical protein